MRSNDHGRADRQKPRQEEAKQRAVTRVNTEQASSEYQPKGARGGRAEHATAKATDSGWRPELPLDAPGVLVTARCEGRTRNTGDPNPHAERPARDRAYKGETEVAQRGKGVRGAHSTGEGGDKPLEGRGPALMVPVGEGKREGMTALTRRGAGSVGPTTPKTKCENFNDGYGERPSGIRHDVFMRSTTGSGGVTSYRKHGDGCGRTAVRRASTKRRSTTSNGTGWTRF